MCEASEQKLRDIDIADLLQLSAQQLAAVMQLRSDFLDRCAAITHTVSSSVQPDPVLDFRTCPAADAAQRVFDNLCEV